ncbi:hypothetical protein ACPBEH_11110 [Latilactobacillus sp. 5-91]|uniref:hypothetical protein n=1 Tax=Latilactobacillus sp. 5-91 TaxID=3410924 RepID=UPI003C73BEDC
MQIIMFIGIILSSIGLILLAATTRWVNGWLTNYKTTNRPVSLFGWFLLIVGLAIIIAAAYANGQLG